MKRSDINRIIRENIAFAESLSFRLPPFAYWTAGDWEAKGPEYDEIRDNMLGWDVSDYGLGEFLKTGIVAFTLRNGSRNDPRYKKPYAEKILILEEGQEIPNHFHWSKMEDIINRGGGDFMVKLYNSAPDEGLSPEPVTVYMDGRVFAAEAGAVVRLKPGESITLTQGQYHSFWADGGKVLLGEVSMVNDDNIDNRFYVNMPRFSEIEEDEPKEYLLCNEYPSA